MRATPMTRRGALEAVAGLCAAALASCNAPQQAAVQPQPPAPAAKIAAITIDTSGLPAVSGETTAAWVQSSLPGQLARAFESAMAPGDPDGATLSVQIVSVTLGMVSASGAIDSISGAATLGGGKAAAKSVTLDTTSLYSASPADQTLPQPALQRRVDALARTFAARLPGKFEM